MSIITYRAAEVALAGVGLLSLLESIRFPSDNGRFNSSSDNKERKNVLTALQIETAVNAIAAFVYSQMIIELKKSSSSSASSSSPRQPGVLLLRYADWFFTTPLLLLSLVLYSTQRRKSGWRMVSDSSRRRYADGHMWVFC